MAKAKPPTEETREARFKRVAEPRLNDILKKIRVLGNCANQHAYSFTPEQIEKIFSAINSEAEKTKALFTRRTPPPTVRL